MNIKEVKKLAKTVGIKKWIESGLDVLEVGDRLINKKYKFSRLDMYNEVPTLTLMFYETEELLNSHVHFAPCGEITFNNGGKIFYEIRSIGE